MHFENFFLGKVQWEKCFREKCVLEKLVAPFGLLQDIKLISGKGTNRGQNSF